MGLFDRFRKGGMSEKHIQSMIDSGVTDDMTEEQSVQVMQADLDSKVRQLQQVREDIAELDEKIVKARAYEQKVLDEFYLYHPQAPEDKMLPDGAPVAVRHSPKGAVFDYRDLTVKFDRLQPVGDGYFYNEGWRNIKDYTGLTEAEREHGEPMHHFRREPNVIPSHGRAELCSLYRDKDCIPWKKRLEAPDYTVQLPPKEFKESRLDALAMRTEKYMCIESSVVVNTEYCEKPVFKYQYDYYPESRRQDIYNWINEQMYRCEVVKDEQGLVDLYTPRVDYAKMLACLQLDEFKNELVGKHLDEAEEEPLINQKKAELLFETIQRQGGITKAEVDFLKDNKVVGNWDQNDSDHPYFYHQEVAEKYAQLREQGIEFPQLK